jgi:hypothetical protein
MNLIASIISVTVMIGTLAACTNPYDPTQRGAGGALLGAASGAAIGGAVGGGHGAGVGAAIGGVTGLLGGLATTPGNYGPAVPQYYQPPQPYSPPPYAYGPSYGYHNPTCLTPSCSYPGYPYGYGAWR